MIGYWITECIPFAIVSLLPIPLFPLFGIMKSKEVTQIYFSDILMLFFGGTYENAILMYTYIYIYEKQKIGNFYLF